MTFSRIQPVIDENILQIVPEAEFIFLPVIQNFDSFFFPHGFTLLDSFLGVPWITLLFTLKSVIFGSKSHSYSPGVRADHTLIHPKNVRSHSYSPQKWRGVQMAHLLYDKIINFIMKVCNTVHTCKFKTPIKHFLDFLLGHHTDEFGTCFLR